MSSSLVALVVAHEATETLSDVLVAVQAQTMKPGATYVIDCSPASDTEIAGLIGRIAPKAHRISAPRAKNISQALNQAFADKDAALNTYAWAWVLHSDSIPEPDCLNALWANADRSRTIGAVGPKQMCSDGAHIIECGIQATSTARRADGILSGEIDQGQYDSTSDVLGIGTAGMLVSTVAWNTVGGLDTALGPFGEGLDFSRRLHLAGYRVVVAPKAKVRHLRTSYIPPALLALSENTEESLDDQPATASDDASVLDLFNQPASIPTRVTHDMSFGQRRFAQLYNWAKGVRAFTLPFLALWLAFWSPARAFGRLVTGRSELFWPELRAWLRLIAITPHLLLARHRAARSRIVPVKVLRELYASGRQVRDSARRRRQAIGQDKDEDQLVTTSRAQYRSRSRVAFATIMFVAIALSVAFWWGRTSSVSGGAWRTLPSSWSDLWDAAWASWIPGGDGMAGPNDPLLIPFALITWPFSFAGIEPTTVIGIIAMFTGPLACLSAWRLTGRLTQSIAVRALGSLAWAFLPSLSLAASQGRIGPALFHVLLPLAVDQWFRVVIAPEPLRIAGAQGVVELARSERAGALARFALTSAFLVAALPSMLLAVIFALIVATATRRLPWVRALLALLPSVVLVTPLYAFALTSPGGWRALLDASGGTFASTSAPSWFTVLGLASAASSILEMSIWVAPSAFLIIGGVACSFAVMTTSKLGAHRRNRVVPLIVFTSALILASTPFASRLDAGLSGATTTTIWTGTYFSLGAVGMLVAIALSSSHAKTWDAKAPFWLKLVAFIGTIGIVAGGALPAFTHIRALGADGDLTQTQRLTSDHVVANPNAIAAVSKQAQMSETAGRVLVLDADATFFVIDANVWRANGPSFTDSTALTRAIAYHEATAGVPSDAATADLQTLVLTLVSYPDASTVQAIGEHGIDSILVRSDCVQVQQFVQALASAPDIERVGETDAGYLWRIRPQGRTPARVSLNANSTVASLDSGLLDARGTVENTGTNATVQLAERAHSGWKATVNGTELTPQLASNGWAQAFSGVTDGELHVWHQSWWQLPWMIASLVALGFAFLAGIPWRKRRS